MATPELASSELASPEPMASARDASEASQAHPPVPAVQFPAGMTAMDRLSAASVRPVRSVALRLAWVATVVALIVLAGALVVERKTVVAYWPPSVRLYAALGASPTVESPHPPAH